MAGLERPLRVAHLTDLHYGPYIQEGSVRTWVEATLAEEPDLILITGDFVDTQDTEPLMRQLLRLDAPLGVWGVWGNHDYAQFGHSIPILHQALDAAGIRILNNEGVRVRSDLYLAGVDDLWKGEPQLDAALATRGTYGACLLMSHNPDLLPNVPPSVTLTLSGHTHGGQIKVPGFGPLVTASSYGRRFAEGWITTPAHAFVSRGLGFSLLPLRYACPAEIVILELVPA